MSSSERPSYLRLIRNRCFGLLWSAQLVSQSGDAIFDVALLWLVLINIGSTALVGVTQAAVTFGWLAGIVSVGPIFLGAVALLVISLALYLPFSELRNASY